MPTIKLSYYKLWYYLTWNSCSKHSGAILGRMMGGDFLYMFGETKYFISFEMFGSSVSDVAVHVLDKLTLDNNSCLQIM